MIWDFSQLILGVLSGVCNLRSFLNREFIVSKISGFFKNFVVFLQYSNFRYFFKCFSTYANWFLLLQIFIALPKITQFFFSQRKIPLWEPYWYLVSLEFKFNFTQNNYLRVDAFDREEFFIFRISDFTNLEVHTELFWQYFFQYKWFCLFLPFSLIKLCF